MSDYDGVGIGDLMTVEECAEEIGRLDAKLKALEAENKALLEAAQAVVDDGRPDDTGGQYRVDNEIFEDLAMLTHPEIYMEKK